MCVRFLGEFSLGDNEHVFCFLGDFGFRKYSFNPQLVFFDDLGDRDEHWGPSMHKGCKMKHHLCDKITHLFLHRHEMGCQK